MRFKPLIYYLRDFKNEPVGTKEDTIGAVLSRTTSSHEPVFILDGAGRYLGAISVHQSLYKRHYPLGTKVSNAIFHTPRIFIDDSLIKVVDSMLSTRLYRLPVIDNESKIVGVLAVQDILNDFANSRSLLRQISSKVTFRKPITASIKTKVKDIFTDFRKMKISRFILVDEKGKMVGIVARSDIKEAFIKTKPRERFVKNAVPFMNEVFEAEEVYRGDDPVSEYYTPSVFTTDTEEDVTEIVRKLIVSEFKSLVIKNKANRPVGFISYRDLLEAIVSLMPKEKISLTFEYPKAKISGPEMNQAGKILERRINKLDRLATIEKVEVSFDEAKFQGGKIIYFETSIRVTRTGKNLFTKAKGETFLNSIEEALKEIEIQAFKVHQDKTRTVSV
ncbi:MAG: CBS domain-containing protein [bacterium]|nr:CBS domain-containing protein [bacterium]